MRGWFPVAKTADGDILPKLQSMQAASRDLANNAPVGRAALRRATTNAVGGGLTLQSRVDRNFLNISDEQANAWERTAEREFRLWSKYCDASRTQNFREMQGLVFYNALLSGDIFGLLPYIKHKDSPYQLRVKLIEADNCINPLNLLDSNKTAGGIEVDGNGAPVKYFFKRSQPLDPVNLSPLVYSNVVGVPAFGARSGRPNVIHVFYKERPGQRRGVPLLAPVMEQLKQISRLSEAELMAALIAAFFTVFVKSDTPGVGLAGSIDESLQVADPDSTENPDDANIYEMGAGNILEMDEGQSIDIADPKRPNEKFAPFFEALTKEIGAAIEIPFEQLLLHFSSSYSASRAALLEAWKFYRNRREWLANKFCVPVYDAFLVEAITSGRLQAPGFFQDLAVREAWSGSSWGGPGQGQIDPIRETKAAILRVNNYLSTFEEERVEIKGGDWEGTINRASREDTLIKDKDFQIIGKGSIDDPTVEINQG